MLADASNGTPLAVMDSASITTLRTGAATAVAAKFLARDDARTASVVGCGVQGDVQLAAVIPLQRALLLDTDHTRAEKAAARAMTRLGLRAEAAKRPPRCTSRERRLRDLHAGAARICHGGDIAPGTFIAAVGADNRGKQEIDPTLVASATFVVDVLEQCAEIGELQHALAAS
jgi:alanine dehydrogenase